MTTEIRVKRGTAAAWTSANPTLGPGEFGYETDTGALKVGDGSTTWTSLDYFLGQAVGTTSSVTFADVQITTASPSANSAVTKTYVDAVAAGLNWHEQVKYATTGELSGSPTYDNGVNNDGIGSTLTASSNGRLQVDGSNASNGERILVKNETYHAHHGIYEVTDQGSVSTPYVLTRASDLDGSDGRTIDGGEAVYVREGAVNSGQGFVITSSGTGAGHIVGTDHIDFTQFTGTSAITAGNGLTSSGNTINVVTADSGRIAVSANSIDLGVVSQLNTTGSNGTSFVQSHTVDSYGRVTGTVTASVQDASTAQKGIARFNSDNFSVSSGSVSIVDASTSVKGIAQFNSSNFSVTGGSVSIANNGITLGTHTTGNYISDIVVTGGLSLSHTPGEGSTASISLDSLISSSSVGSAGTYFVSEVNVNGNGQVTSVTSADVQDASTSQKGIARFNSSHFSVSSGSVSIASNAVALGTNTTGNYMSNVVAGTGVSISHTAGEGSTASIQIGQSVGTLDTPTFAGATLDAVRIGITAANEIDTSVGDLLLDSNGGNVIIEDNTTLIGRVYRSSSSAQPAVASSVGFFFDRYIGESGSTAFVIKDSSNGSAHIFELRNWVDSPQITIKGVNDGYRFDSLSSSLSSASINTASISSASINTASISSASIVTASLSSASVANNLVIGGNLTVNGTTTTVNSTILTVDDPILTLGGDTAPTSDDNKDRGIEFRYHSGTAASVGFMGYDDSAQMFTFLVGATNSSEVFSGTAASVNAGMIYINGAQIAATHLSNGTTGTGSIVLATGPTIAGPTTMSGSVAFSGSVSLPATTDWPEQYRTESSSVTLSLANHQYNVLEMTAGSGTSVITVPGDGVANFPVGSVIQIIRVGAGEVQVTASAGVTVNNAVGTRLRAQWSTATLRKRAANTWLLSGDLKV